MHRWLTHYEKAIVVQEVYHAAENVHSRCRCSHPGAPGLRCQLQLPRSQELRPEVGEPQAQDRPTRLRRGWTRWAAVRLPEEARRRLEARPVADPLRPAAHWWRDAGDRVGGLQLRLREEGLARLGPCRVGPHRIQKENPHEPYSRTAYKKWYGRDNKPLAPLP